MAVAVEGIVCDIAHEKKSIEEVVEKSDEDSDNVQDEEADVSSEILNVSTGSYMDDDHLDADVDSDPNSEDGDGQQQGLAGMSDVISKILGKSLAPEKDAVLAKCKKSNKRKTELIEERGAKREKRDAKKAVLEKNHVIPTRSNAHAELMLRKIATKGVVKLFNAVSAHQKSMSEKMKDAKTEARKSKAIEGVSKSSFLEFLKDENNSKKKDVSKKVVTKQEASSEDDLGDEEQKPSWNVLRDDFMMGAKFKDWDKDEKEDAEDDASDISTDEEDEDDNEKD